MFEPAQRPDKSPTPSPNTVLATELVPSCNPDVPKFKLPAPHDVLTDWAGYNVRGGDELWKDGKLFLILSLPGSQLPAPNDVLTDWAGYNVRGGDELWKDGKLILPGSELPESHDDLSEALTSRAPSP